MGRLYSSQLKQAIGKKAVAAGWVQDIRLIGGLKFLVVKDREGFFQITLPKKAVSPEIFAVPDKLTKESVVLVEGEVKAAAQAAGGIEVIPARLEVVSLAGAPTPLDTSGKIASGLDARLDYRFLDLRNHKSIALFKLRAKMLKYVIDYFDAQGFFNINTPKLTSAGVESGAELFEVKYFDRKAYLAQSPQIYKQMMVCAGFEKVFEIGAVYRAEKSQTTRHLTEFTGVDFEMGFIDSFQEPMDVIEGMFKHVLAELNRNCAAELALFDRKPLVPKKIPRITMDEAKKLLAERGKKIPAGEDLDPEAERLIAKIVKEKFGEEFVFVTHYPYSKRPFYHMKPAGQPDVTLSFDLIWNGIEVSTGAQREHRYEVLKAQAQEKGLDLDAMTDYANLFKYGAPPHGGAGLGLDRFVECLLELDNIREGILLPRDPVRLTP